MANDIVADLEIEAITAPYGLQGRLRKAAQEISRLRRKNQKLLQDIHRGSANSLADRFEADRRIFEPPRRSGREPPCSSG